MQESSNLDASSWASAESPSLRYCLEREHFSIGGPARHLRRGKSGESVRGLASTPFGIPSEFNMKSSIQKHDAHIDFLEMPKIPCNETNSALPVEIDHRLDGDGAARTSGSP